MNKPNNFALIGTAGYIAPKHLQAIRDTGNRVVAAVDPHDSVGVLDSYFPGTAFFVEFERFDRHAEKLRRKGENNQIDYVSICSPNYLHDAHIRFALRIGANAICEKPLVISPWNLDALTELQAETDCKIYTILQLRHSEAALQLKKMCEQAPRDQKLKIDLTYITGRGKWYFFSWKGDDKKSGGIAINIGIHLFDLLLWLFGKPSYTEVHYADDKKIGGFLELENAFIRWFLSVDIMDVPTAMKEAGTLSHRSITVNGTDIDFSQGFANLHTIVYRNIIAGKGCGITDARPSIEFAYNIRKLAPLNKKSDRVHPLLIKSGALD